jgi:hypothetical protein
MSRRPTPGVRVPAPAGPLPAGTCAAAFTLDAMRHAAHEEGSMDRASQHGRIGYLVLYLLGAPVGLLLLRWVILGDNLIGAG